MNDPANRGNEAEMLVRKALEMIREDPPIVLSTQGREVERFIHAKKNSWLDKLKVDFLVFLADQKRVFIQVKSSARKHAKCLRKLHKWRDIFLAILVEAKDTIESIYNKLVQGIVDMFAKLEQHKLTEAEREKQIDLWLSRMNPCGRKARAREMRENDTEVADGKKWCFRFHAPRMAH